VLSTNQTAVAFAMMGFVIFSSFSDAIGRALKQRCGGGRNSSVSGKLPVI